MKPHLRRRLPSIALAGLVLVIAMAASATAAVKITGADIKNGTITGIDVKNGSLSGADVRNGTVGGGDVRDGSLRARDLSDAARASLTIIGSPCQVPPADTAGTVVMEVGEDGTIALVCDVPAPPIVDADGDGFTSDVDCDDADASVNPGATEIADGKDNDCDGAIDEGLSVDADGDGHSPPEDCDDSDATVNPEAPEIPDDGVDNDCDGLVDET